MSHDQRHGSRRSGLNHSTSFTSRRSTRSTTTSNGTGLTSTSSPTNPSSFPSSAADTLARMKASLGRPSKLPSPNENHSSGMSRQPSITLSSSNRATSPSKFKQNSSSLQQQHSNHIRSSRANPTLSSNPVHSNSVQRHSTPNSMSSRSKETRSNGGTRPNWLHVAAKTTMNSDAWTAVQSDLVVAVRQSLPPGTHVSSLAPSIVSSAVDSAASSIIHSSSTSWSKLQAVAAIATRDALRTHTGAVASSTTSPQAFATLWTDAAALSATSLLLARRSRDMNLATVNTLLNSPLPGPLRSALAFLATTSPSTPSHSPVAPHAPWSQDAMTRLRTTAVGATVSALQSSSSSSSTLESQPLWQRRQLPSASPLSSEQQQLNSWAALTVALVNAHGDCVDASLGPLSGPGATPSQKLATTLVNSVSTSVQALAARGITSALETPVSSKAIQDAMGSRGSEEQLDELSQLLPTPFSWFTVFPSRVASFFWDQVWMALIIHTSAGGQDEPLSPDGVQAIRLIAHRAVAACSVALTALPGSNPSSLSSTPLNSILSAWSEVQDLPVDVSVKASSLGNPGITSSMASLKRVLSEDPIEPAPPIPIPAPPPAPELERTGSTPAVDTPMLANSPSPSVSEHSLHSLGDLGGLSPLPEMEGEDDAASISPVAPSPPSAPWSDSVGLARWRRVAFAAGRWRMYLTELSASAAVEKSLRELDTSLTDSLGNLRPVPSSGEPESGRRAGLVKAARAARLASQKSLESKLNADPLLWGLRQAVIGGERLVVGSEASQIDVAQRIQRWRAAQVASLGRDDIESASKKAQKKASAKAAKALKKADQRASK